VTVPPNAGEDSFSLLPILHGDDRPIRANAVNCAGNGWPSVRMGTWKLIPGQPAQLYDLATDLGETRNLAGEHPDRVRDMTSLLDQLIGRGRSTPGPAQTNDVEVRRYQDKPSLAALRAGDRHDATTSSSPGRRIGRSSPSAKRQDSRGMRRQP